MPKSWASTSYGRESLKTYLPASWNGPSGSRSASSAMVTHFRQNHLGKFQDMLTELKGLFGVPTYGNSLKERQANFEIETDQNSKIRFRGPYRISPHAEEELRRQIYKAIFSGGIQPTRSKFGLQVLFLPKHDGTLCM